MGNEGPGGTCGTLPHQKTETRKYETDTGDVLDRYRILRSRADTNYE